MILWFRYLGRAKMGHSFFFSHVAAVKRWLGLWASEDSTGLDFQDATAWTSKLEFQDATGSCGGELSRDVHWNIYMCLSMYGNHKVVGLSTWTSHWTRQSGRSCTAYSDLTLDIRQHHFSHILLVTVESYGQPRFKGRGNRSHFLIGHRQGHIVDECAR